MADTASAMKFLGEALERQRRRLQRVQSSCNAPATHLQRYRPDHTAPVTAPVIGARLEPPVGSSRIDRPQVSPELFFGTYFRNESSDWRRSNRCLLPKSRRVCSPTT